jgi:hypothetical protein
MEKKRGLYIRFFLKKRVSGLKKKIREGIGKP